MLFDLGFRYRYSVPEAALCFASASAMAVSHCVDGKGKVNSGESSANTKALCSRLGFNRVR